MQIPWRRKNRTEGERGKKKIERETTEEREQQRGREKEFAITPIEPGACRLRETSQNPSRPQNRGEYYALNTFPSLTVERLYWLSY